MWLKLSDTARDNKKIRRLAAALNVSYAEALGHLALLWLWRIGDGELTGFTAEEIATTARWRGNARQFLKLLVLGGFVDVVDSRAVLHDHEDHQGSVKETRRKARQRARKRGALPHSGGRPSLSQDVVVSCDAVLSRDAVVSGDTVLSRDTASSRDAALSRDTALSRDGPWDSTRSPATDPLGAEIDERFDAIVAPQARH